MKKLKASEEFIVGKNDISWIGSNFKKNLYHLSFETKESEGLETRTLPRYMNDTAIAKEFGPAPIELGDVLAYLKDADRNEWYIFYVRDTKGKLWAVRAGWGGGGWGVGALPVTRPGEWGGGNHVVSRKFLIPSEKTLGDLDSLTLRVEELERIVRNNNLCTG